MKKRVRYAYLVMRGRVGKLSGIFLLGRGCIFYWSVVPKDVASLPFFAFGSRVGFVVEGVLISAFVKCFLVRWGGFVE